MWVSVMVFLYLHLHLFQMRHPYFFASIFFLREKSLFIFLFKIELRKNRAKIQGKFPSLFRCDQVFYFHRSHHLLTKLQCKLPLSSIFAPCMCVSTAIFHKFYSSADAVLNSFCVATAAAASGLHQDGARVRKSESRSKWERMGVQHELL